MFCNRQVTVKLIGCINICSRQIKNNICQSEVSVSVRPSSEQHLPCFEEGGTDGRIDPAGSGLSDSLFAVCVTGNLPEQLRDGQHRSGNARLSSAAAQGTARLDVHLWLH